MKNNTWITSCIARCMDCDWSDESLRHARNRAYQHHKKTGHKVIVESAKVIHYERAKEAADGQE